MLLLIKNRNEIHFLFPQTCLNRLKKNQQMPTETDTHVFNPKTGRWVKKGGKIHTHMTRQKLLLSCASRGQEVKMDFSQKKKPQPRPVPREEEEDLDVSDFSSDDQSDPEPSHDNNNKPAAAPPSIFDRYGI